MHPSRCAAVWFGCLLTLGVGAVGGAAQQASEHRLATPDAAYPEGFGSVRGVRELPDGRVLVSDGLGQALIVADLDSGAADTLGRVGGGPEEYRTPDALLPLPGDRTLLLDLGNGRLSELAADLSFTGETSPIARPAAGSGPGMQIVIPRGVDDRGRIYYQANPRPRPGSGQMPDSAAVVRLDREAGTADTVARVKLEERDLTTSGGAENRTVRMEPKPLTRQDAWAVSWDGRVAVARSGDYHLDWILPDGQLVRGPAVPYRPLPVTRSDKEAWVEAISGGLRVMVTADSDGRMQTNFSRGGGGDTPDVDRYEWPETKPPFPGNAVLVSESGEAWVERHVRAGDAPLYDVFGPDGELRARVRLPEGREIAAFGDGVVYLTHRDEFDFEWLERYALPRI